jgi:acyl-CoA thioesterase
MTANRRNQNRMVITSFMLRFVRETDEAEEILEQPDSIPEPEIEAEDNHLNKKPGWRGVVKHIQSGEEHHFSTLLEAETFIRKYIED